MTNTTSLATIKKLRQMFSTHGLPETLVTDNGTAFTSEDFRSLSQEMEFLMHIKTASYHPASNWLAERAVQTFIDGMQKRQTESGSLEAKLAQSLLTYRTMLTSYHNRVAAS